MNTELVRYTCTCEPKTRKLRLVLPKDETEPIERRQISVELHAERVHKKWVRIKKLKKIGSDHRPALKVRDDYDKRITYLQDVMAERVQLEQEGKQSNNTADQERLKQSVTDENTAAMKDATAAEAVLAKNSICLAKNVTDFIKRCPQVRVCKNLRPTLDPQTSAIGRLENERCATADRHKREPRLKPMTLISAIGNAGNGVGGRIKGHLKYGDKCHRRVCA
ncbi:uncharacterized protein BYT42DRAFT_617067 [Radiomyces spectabilis]|uniref:uncharacterized protein n=1 Tax=Radiomyces spectabilis TaxID=64574 RepID=UPI00221FEF94|nr:uncharacterized protein BYT42DRAFT_617067 [Radiomyces spectabilis]KAI8370520.1 hypothetical protein BYT42DRAFT_617067 [Radiomyces spectabilis]